MDRSTLTSQLCQYCQSFNLRGLRRHSNGIPDSSIQSEWLGPAIGHITKHEDQCQLCGCIKCVLEASGELLGNSDRRTKLRFLTPYGYISDGISPWVVRKREDIGQRGMPKYVEAGDRRSKSGVAGLGVVSESVPGSNDFPEHCRHGLRISLRRSAQDRRRAIFMRAEIPQTFDESSLDCARNWLVTCEDKHWFCKRNLAGTGTGENYIERELPTRVLDLSSATAIRLLLTEGRKGKYVALSYCWGSAKCDDPFTLKKDTSARIPNQATAMPQTIRDAIEITRQLQIPYLWVDALCIVQDDPIDWEREAKYMATVYQNATLTLAILGDRSTYSGFLEPRSEAFEHNNKRILRFDDLTCSPTPPFEIPSGYTRVKAGLEQEIDSSKWNTRAWTLQESRLSRRILYFGTDQVYWECQEETWSEDGFDEKIVVESQRRKFAHEMAYMDSIFAYGIEKAGHTWENAFKEAGRGMEDSKRYVAISRTRTAIASVAKPVLKGVKGLERTWDRSNSTGGTSVERELFALLSDYSNRKLTVASDKLLAFEGVGSIIASRTRQPFIAGNWAQHFVRGLFFFSVRDHLKRLRPAIAPSWSWAAWSGHLQWHPPEPRFFETGQYKQLQSYDIVRDGGGAFGALKNVEHIDENFTMTRQPGVIPASVRFKAFMTTVWCPQTSCMDYPQTIKQLRDDVALWPQWYEAWPAERMFLLYAGKTDTDSDTSLRAQSFTHCCSTCQADTREWSESQILLHRERCRSTLPALPPRRAKALDSLVGVAMFDEQQAIRSKVEAVMLWSKSHLQTVSSAEVSSVQILDNSGITNPEALMRSTQSILGFRSTQALRGTLAQTRIAKWRRYHLLLVEQTERAGHYRRVGIGLGYRIGGVPRFGGQDLHDHQRMRQVILV